MGILLRTEASRRDYQLIWDYIAQDDSKAADSVLEAFDARLRLLSDVPYAGKPRDELRRGLRSVPVGNYTISYRPRDDGIQLMRVLHSARDLRRIFKRR